MKRNYNVQDFLLKNAKIQTMDNGMRRMREILIQYKKAFEKIATITDGPNNHCLILKLITHLEEIFETVKNK